eukprot:2700673-Pleurochrysis_carterae.AAC.1
MFHALGCGAGWLSTAGGPRATRREAQGDWLDGKPSSAKGPYAGLRGREVVQACRRAKVAGDASAGPPCSSCAPRARGKDGEPGAVHESGNPERGEAAWASAVACHTVLMRRHDVSCY